MNFMNTRKRIFWFLLALLVATPFFAQGFRGRLSFAKSEVKRVKDSVHVRFEAVLDGIDLDSKALLTLTPQLVDKEGQNSYRFPDVKVARRQRSIVWQRQNPNAAPSIVLRMNGMRQTVDFTYAAPYSAWMNKAALEVRQTVSGCADCLLAEETFILKPAVYAPKMQDSESQHSQRWQPQFHFRACYQVPEQEAVKVRTAKFMARFTFHRNRTELLQTLGNNEDEFRRVDSVAQRILLNPDVKVQNVTIDGYASPEGEFTNNQRLAYQRAMAFVNYLQYRYGLRTEMFAVAGHGEDWKGLQKMISASNMNYRQEILDIINYTPSHSARKMLLKELAGGYPYRYMLNMIYPQLRRTEYQFTYQVRSFGAEEAIRRIKTYPEMLSLNEMYLVAKHYPEGSEERKEALKTAALYYPENPVSRFNSLAARLVRPLSDEEANLLISFPASPEQINNLGIHYAWKGEYDKAKACFEKVSHLPEARHNLAEILKME